MPNIRLSVALVTRNRLASLERTLRSLRGQSVQPFEVVLSDDSDEVQSDAVAHIAHDYGCKYVRGPQRGLYANRNHVAQACVGTHIRTMDDDHEFPEAHFEKCIGALEQDAESVWIIGEHNAGSAYFVPPPCPGELTPRGFSATPPDPQNCWAISDGASIYPRTIFDREIRYVEAFKFGASYLEFGSRLRWLGYRIRQLLTTFVIHQFDWATRSFSDSESDMASRFFAMQCHSHVYQPNLSNKLLSGFEIVKELIRHRRVARRALAKAQHAFREHRRMLWAHYNFFRASR
jgi:glycosyltransferase involved in cell wall biosynthesis